LLEGALVVVGGAEVRRACAMSQLRSKSPERVNARKQSAHALDVSRVGAHASPELVGCLFGSLDAPAGISDRSTSTASRSRASSARARARSPALRSSVHLERHHARLFSPAWGWTTSDTGGAASSPISRTRT
jgi:hypothetical protein